MIAFSLIRPHFSLRLRLIRCGFSLIELVVTIAVISILSSGAIFIFSDAASPINDASAKAALVTFENLQIDAATNGPTPLTAAALTAGSYDRGTTTFTDGPSTAPNVVSVSVAGSVAVGAVSSADSGPCWVVRLDLAPTTASPLVWWFLWEAPAACPPASISFLFPNDGTGQSINAPTVVS